MPEGGTLVHAPFASHCTTIANSLRRVTGHPGGRNRVRGLG